MTLTLNLIYKLSGLTLVSGAATAGYLLIPSSPVENKEKISKTSKNSSAWKKGFELAGYKPVDMSQPWELVSGLLDTFKKSKKIEDGKASEELRKLCNSFEEKEILSSEEEQEAKRWCVEPKEVEKIIKGMRRKPVYSIENEYIKWNDQKLRELAKKYLNNQEANLKMESSWDNSEPLSINDGETQGSLESFKKACENVLNSKSFEENIQNKINQAVHWCTEE